MAETLIYHRVCLGPAFTYDAMPAAGAPIDPRHATLLDGTKPRHGEDMVCGTCGEQIMDPGAELGCDRHPAEIDQPAGRR